MKNQKELWLMNIKDKIPLPNTTACCPPHRIPHTAPFFGELITNEPCHIHKAGWRMAHHTPYCKFLNCPNYKKMIEFHRKWKKENEKNP
jgi:hypothetical protein